MSPTLKLRSSVRRFTERNHDLIESYETTNNVQQDTITDKHGNVLFVVATIISLNCGITECLIAKDKTTGTRSGTKT